MGLDRASTVDLLPFDLAGRRLLIAPASAGGPFDPAAVLLAGALRLAAGQTVIDLNCGAGLAGAAARAQSRGGRVVLAAATVVDQAAAERTLAANGLTDAAVYLSAGTANLPPLPPADVALVRLPKGSWPARQLIWDAFQVLRPGGHLYLAGGNDEGIRPALRQAESLFGTLAILAYGKGHRIGLATRPTELPPLPDAFADPLLDHASYHRLALTLRGTPYTICSRPGVFAWDRIDAGTAALIEAMHIRPGERVLDLGCGSGILGAVAARLAGDGTATLIDSAAEALASARQTLAASDVTNAEVLASDGIAAVGDRRFDVVVSNPPFHQGQATSYAAALAFITGAAAVLRAGGRLYVVANRFLPYQDPIRRAFGNAIAIQADSRYNVLLATKNAR